MVQILSKYTASISELKKSPSSIIEAAGNEAVAILNHNRPSAYLVPRELYEKMLEMIEDYQLSQEVEERLADGETPVRVDLDAL
jgi:antitoxin StbD